MNTDDLKCAKSVYLDRCRQPGRAWFAYSRNLLICSSVSVIFHGAPLAACLPSRRPRRNQLCTVNTFTP
jgi:hypothetical protein